jgi:diguanylate cyclase (GGDEF)-like protein/PAS domain S-box-containing protein
MPGTEGGRVDVAAAAAGTERSGAPASGVAGRPPLSPPVPVSISEQSMLLVLDSSPDGIVAVDAAGRIVYANRAAEAMFGWSVGELVGLSVERLIPAAFADRHVELRHEFLAAHRARPMGLGLDLTALHRDGRELAVEIGLVTVETSDGPLVFATVVDISARAALASKLDQANEELRRHVVDLERRRQEMALLAQLGERLDRCQTMAEAYAVMTEGATTLFGADAGALYEPVGPGDRLQAVVTWGDPPPVTQAFASSECRALVRGRTHVVGDAGGRLRCAHVTEQVGTGLVCVPVATRGEDLSVLHVQVRRRVRGVRPGAQLAARRRLTQMLAERIALTLANLRLRAALREQSIRDELTGLFNRRYMEETLDRELRRARREGYGLGVIMADLDHFKSYNDARGHAAGDVVLRTMGSFLGAAVRGGDVACRFGGEEFVIILPRAGLEDTRRRAESLREQLRALHLDTLTPPLQAVTMSFGVAACPDHGMSRDRLMAAADEALYLAKAAGRDRVVVASVGERGTIVVVPAEEQRAGR